MQDYIEVGNLYSKVEFESTYLMEVDRYSQALIEIMKDRFAGSYARTLFDMSLKNCEHSVFSFEKQWDVEKLIKILNLEEGDIKLLIEMEEKKNDYTYILALTFDEAVFLDCESVLRTVFERPKLVRSKFRWCKEMEEAGETPTAMHYFEEVERNLELFKEARKAAAFTVASNIVFSIMEWYKQQQKEQVLSQKIYDKEQEFEKKKKERNANVEQIKNHMQEQMEQMKKQMELMEKQFEEKIQKVHEANKNEEKRDAEELQSLKNELTNVSPNSKRESPVDNLQVLVEASETTDLTTSENLSDGQLIEKYAKEDKKKFCQPGQSSATTDVEKVTDVDGEQSFTITADEIKLVHAEASGTPMDSGNNDETPAPPTGETVARRSDNPSDSSSSSSSDDDDEGPAISAFKENPTKKRLRPRRNVRAPSRLSDQIMAGKTYAKAESPTRKSKRSKKSPGGVHELNAVNIIKNDTI